MLNQSEILFPEATMLNLFLFHECHILSDTAYRLVYERERDRQRAHILSPILLPTGPTIGSFGDQHLLYNSNDMHPSKRTQYTFGGNARIFPITHIKILQANKSFDACGNDNNTTT
jgi:hypothetical protein